MLVIESLSWKVFSIDITIVAETDTNGLCTKKGITRIIATKCYNGNHNNKKYKTKWNVNNMICIMGGNSKD